MGFVLTFLGVLALLLSLAGIGLGVYMTTTSNTRELGRLFALWWIPAAAASSGILMRDLVTFVVGLGCFLVAGVFFVSTGVAMRSRRMNRADQWSGVPDNRDASKSRPRNRPAS